MTQEDFLMLTPRKKRSLFILAAFVLAMGLACALLFKPVVSVVENPVAFRAWVDAHRMIGRLAMIGLMTVQVIFAFLPGEPMEIAAGYVFGVWEGLLLCLTGATIGCLVTANLTRRHGRGIMTAFFSQEQIDKLPFFRNPEKQMLTVFLLYLIPGSPKDLFNYALGLTRLNIPRTLALTAVARIPSVITSTISGHALGSQDVPAALITLAATGILSLLGLILYRRMCAKP